MEGWTYVCYEWKMDEPQKYCSTTILMDVVASAVQKTDVIPQDLKALDVNSWRTLAPIGRLKLRTELIGRRFWNKLRSENGISIKTDP